MPKIKNSVVFRLSSRKTLERTCVQVLATSSGDDSTLPFSSTTRKPSIRDALSTKASRYLDFLYRSRKQATIAAIVQRLVVFFYIESHELWWLFKDCSECMWIWWAWKVVRGAKSHVDEIPLRYQTVTLLDRIVVAQRCTPPLGTRQNCTVL
jgi:hypothetical protein